MKVVSHRRSWFVCSLILSFLLLGGWRQTARAGANLDQGSNGTAALPISPIDWINGNAGSSKAHFIEGYSQAYRLDVTSLSGGLTYKVRLAYDIMQGGKHAFDYLTHYSCLLPHNVSDIPFNHPAETVDPLKGLSTGVEFDAPSSLPIPAPNSASSPVANQPTLSFNNTAVCEKKITIYNGTINSITYVSQGDLATTGNSAAEIEIIFTVGTFRDRVLLAWGAHIASAIDWLGNSASEINGSPYHMHFNGLFDLNGNAIGGNSSQDRSLSADAVVNPCEVLDVQCDGLDLCGASVCNPLTALCVNTYVPQGNQCGDPSHTGLCEIGGVCTGDSIYCPATGNAPDNTPCTDSNACTVNDTCQAGVCQPGTPLVCPGASDQCHDAGTCDAANGTCSNPAKDNGTSCTDGNACTQTDTCQAGVCTGSNPVVCQASDQCHVAGICNTGTGACSNPNAPQFTACGSSDNTSCNAPDSCDANGQCVDRKKVAGYVCQSANGICDPAHTCDGTSDTCQPHYAADNTVCGNASGQCANDPVCNGAGQCSAETPKDNKTVCRAQNGLCDLAELCTGYSAQCPDDSKVAAGTTCRLSAGSCDVPEICDGSSKQCPADIFVTAGYPCRDSAGLCDPEEFCTGNSPLCPVNVVFDPNRDKSCEAEFCQTAGFWSSHAGTEKKNGKSQNITLAVIDLADSIRNLPAKDLINLYGQYGKLNICGENIVNTQLNDAASALESMCVSPQGDQRLQLVRQLTAASLNCILSTGSADCLGVDGPSNLKIEDVFAACNLACEAGITNAQATPPDGPVFSCIAALDCWNNGGIFHEATNFCQTGTCLLDGVTACNGSSGCPLYYGQAQSCVSLATTCHGQPLVKDGFFDFDPPGPAGSTDACNQAIANKCTVVAPGEVECKDRFGNIIDSAQ
jgi:hypothetical protein